MKMNRIDAVIEEFLMDGEGRGLSPCTLKAYRAALVTFQRFAQEAGTLDLTEVTTAQLRAFAVQCLADVSPGAAHARLRPLKTLLRWTVTEGLLQEDPMKRVRLPRLPDVPLCVVKPAQFRKLEAAAKFTEKPLRDTAILSVLFDTGMRASELCDLKLDDLQPGGFLTIQQGKGGKSRTVPISRDTLKSLRAYLSRERPDTTLEELFLVSEDGPMNRGTLTQLMRRLCRTAGLPVIGPHAFRRGFVVAFIQQGGDAFSAQRILGHTTLIMTNRYARMDADDLRATHRRASPVSGLKRQGQ